MHAIRIPLGQLRVGLHKLRVETNHHIDRTERICQLCHLQEVEIESHFIFRCPVYYGIRRRFYFLLASFLRYTNQRCLALYLQETFRHRLTLLQPPSTSATTKRITDFFRALPASQGIKRTTDRSLDHDSRSVRIQESCPTRPH